MEQAIRQSIRLALVVCSLALVRAVEIKRPVDVGFAALRGLSFEEAEEVCAPFLSPEGKLGYAPSRHMLIIHDFPEKIEQIKKIIEQVDVDPVNIRIDVTFDGVSRRSSSHIGVDPNVTVRHGHGTARFHGVPGGAAPPPGSTVGGNNRVTIRGNAYDRGGTRVDGATTIHFGAGSEETKDVTNQFVMAGNGRAAKIWVGKSVYDTVWVYDWGVHHGWWRPDMVQTDLGASLYVRPRLLADDLVEIEVFPRITSRGKERLSVDVKELSTKVVARNGQTVSIGGLDQNKRNAYQKLFGVGSLFNGSNLAVSLRPTIIRMPEHLRRAVEEERREKRKKALDDAK